MDAHQHNHPHTDHEHATAGHEEHEHTDTMAHMESMSPHDSHAHGMHTKGASDPEQGHTMQHENHASMDAHAGHTAGMAHDSGMSGHAHHAMMVQDFKRRFFVSLVLTLPILILSPAIQGFLGLTLSIPGGKYILFALSTLLFVYGGKPFFKGALEELKQKAPAMMTLIAFAISVSYLYSALTVFVLAGMDFFWELATLIVIMLLGHWIEMRSVMGASMALEELARLMPDTAHRIGEGGEAVDVPVNVLTTGDVVLVKPGEKVPIDGKIIEGASSINESMITGESAPVDKKAGDEVTGGSVNGDGAFRFTVERVGDNTFLSQVIRLVREAQASKSKTQRLADTAAKWLFFIALASGIATFAVWLALGYGLNFAITRAVTVIVICCPHALGLAIPLVTSVSTSIGAKHGLLIRNRAAFENARNLNTVVFDKTGTLTEGKFGVTDLHADQLTEKELLTYAASVEVNSEHLIAKGILREAEKQNCTLLPVREPLTLPGKGLQATLEGKQIMVVSPGYLREQKIPFDESRYAEHAGQGKTVVFVLVDHLLMGSIALSDIVRDTAKTAVQQLKSMGVQSIMLTGDNRKAAAYVADKLGIDQVFAEMLPDQKAETVDRLHREGRMVAMTGDGINDAPSLAKADLGIAIGTGTDVAVETADVILVKNNPLDILRIIQLSKAIYHKMVQNLAWATGYNILALPLAAGVLYPLGIVLNPAIGAVLMSLSTIIVAINARLLKID
ncbi:MAG: copper-translocating P-type ATPase [Eubacteriales bacterium]|nr:copper-translocating P-type ATPase [Eubacteriales bacterium]